MGPSESTSPLGTQPPTGVEGVELIGHTILFKQAEALALGRSSRAQAVLEAYADKGRRRRVCSGPDGRLPIGAFPTEPPGEIS